MIELHVVETIDNEREVKILCEFVVLFSRYAKTVGAKHFHTSAKLNKGIEEMFFELTKSKLNLKKCQ